MKRRQAAHTAADRKRLEAAQRRLLVTPRKIGYRVYRVRKPKPLPPAPPRPPSAEERANYLRAKEWAAFGGPPEIREQANG